MRRVGIAAKCPGRHHQPIPPSLDVERSQVRRGQYHRTGVVGVTPCAVILGAAGPRRKREQIVAAGTGLQYDIHMTMASTSAGSAIGQSRPMRLHALAHVRVAGGAARVDVVEGSFAGGMLGDGDFLTLHDNGRMLLVFKSHTRHYAQLDLDNLSRGLHHVAASVGSTLGVQATNVRIDVAALDARETLEQCATLRYRLTEDYTVRISVMGMHSAITTHSTTDYWFASEMTTIINPFLLTPGQGGQPTSFLGSAYADQMAVACGTLPDGVPIKTVMIVTTTDATGNCTTTSTTWALTDFAREAMIASEFDVPAGYVYMPGALASPSP
jgi:hypothetical protein